MKEKNTAMPAEAPVKDSNESARRRSTKKRIVNIVLDILIYGFCLALIIGATAFAFSEDTGKSIFGYRFYNVLTVSMRPEFDAGDMIFVELCQPDELAVGDVVTFALSSRDSNVFLTHRITEILSDDAGVPEKIVTKGDYNDGYDPPTPVESVVGIYRLGIPKLGAVIQFIRENLILMSVSILSFFVLIVFLRAYFDARKDTKESRESEAT